MKGKHLRIAAAILLLGATCAMGPAQARHYTRAQIRAMAQALGIDVKGDAPLGVIFGQDDGLCHTRMSNGYPLPDSGCTPGAMNPTLTLEILKDSRFRTGQVRNRATSATKKNHTYAWYAITKPAHNTGRTQVCELDHLVSLELGGADTLDNIWPQCGPSRVSLNRRYFKQKDTVENYLAAQVRDGKMDLHDVQFRIAQDWTQYLEAAKQWQAAMHRRHRRH